MHVEKLAIKLGSASLSVKQQIETVQFKRWCLDSGASSHMCAHYSKFQNLKSAKTSVLNLAYNENTKIEGSGIVKINTKEGYKIKLNTTLLVPDLRSNLLSIAKITQAGYKVIFTNKEAIVINPKSGGTLLIAHQSGDIYHVE